MYTVLVLVLLVQPPKKEEPQTEAALRAKVTKEYALEPMATDAPLRKLQKERAIDLAQALNLRLNQNPILSWPLPYDSDYMGLQLALFESLTDLADNPEDKVKCYEMQVGKLSELENIISKRVAFGSDPPLKLPLARAMRIDAEIELLKLKESLMGGK